MIERAFWLDRTPSIESGPPCPPKLDVVVVGAGYAGLSAALTLARAGKSVAVLDAGRVGDGASSLSAGSLGGIPKAGPAALAARYGDAASAQVYAESVQARVFVEGLVSELNLGCGLRRGVRLIAAHNAKAMRRLEAYSSVFRRCMDSVEVLSKSELALKIASEKFHGGLWLQGASTLQPAQLHAGLALAAIAAGVHLLQNCRVLDVRVLGAGYSVETAVRNYAASHVVVATNAQTGNAVSAFRPMSRRMAVVPAFALATTPMGEVRIRSILGAVNSFSDTYKLLHYLAVSDDGQRLIMSARAGFHEGTLQGKAARIFDYFQRRFHGLDDVRISHAWSGVFALSADYIPHIGSEAGMRYVMGCCGTGVTMGPYLGHKVALQILGDAQGVTVFDRPLPPMPIWMRIPAIMALGMRARMLYDQHLS